MAYTKIGDYSSGKVIGTGSGQQSLNAEFNAISTETQAIRSLLLIAGTGLNGGGDLTADRTISISAGGIGTTQLANSGVTEAKLGTGSVTEAKIGAGAITETKLGTGAVTADKIGANAVTEAKINAGAVTADKLGAGAVATAKIADGAVTPAKMNLSTLSAFQASRSTNATWTAGSSAAVGFTNQNYDRLGEYDTTGSSFTPQATGLYLFTVSIVVTPAANGVASLFLRKNAGYALPFTCQYLTTGAARYLCGSCMLELTAGEEVVVFYETAIDLTVNSNALSVFSGIKLA